jgi:hypothetical protein
VLKLIAAPVALIVLSANALWETANAVLAKEKPDCTMVIVVYEGTIENWDCQGGETECDDISLKGQTTDCHLDNEGLTYPEWTCKCCIVVNTGLSCYVWEDRCYVYVNEPPSQFPVLVCTTPLCGPGQWHCPSPPVQTGAVSCACIPGQ